MSDNLRYQDARLRELLAGEYVLGSLHGRARRRFEGLLRQDPAWQTLVNEWAQTFEPLNEHLEPITPPPAVWTRIEQQIRPAQKEPLWSNGVFWRRLGMVAVAASLLLVLLVVPGYRSDTPERLVLVTNKQSRPVWVISTTARADRLKVRTLRPVNLPASKVCKLWLVWKDGATRSVGILSDDVGEKVMRFPSDLQRDPARAELVVTVEDAGIQSTTPEGEMVFKGPWVEL